MNNNDRDGDGVVTGRERRGGERDEGGRDRGKWVKRETSWR